MSVSRERHWFERTANDIAVQRGLQLLAGAEMVGLKHLLAAAMNALTMPPFIDRLLGGPKALREG